MATFVLIPGAGSDSWYWHLVVPELRAAGHDVVAVDLPCDDDSAGLDEYADVVVDAIGEPGRRRRPRGRGPVDGRVHGAAGLRTGAGPPDGARRRHGAGAGRDAGGDWWTNTGQGEAMRAAAIDGGYSVDDFDEAVMFLHDVPADVVAEGAAHLRDQSGTPFEKPWPLDRWPDVPTRFLLCRDDRLFPADFQRRVVRERLGFDPDEMHGGHLPALARPHDLAAAPPRLLGRAGLSHRLRRGGWSSRTERDVEGEGEAAAAAAGLEELAHVALDDRRSPTPRAGGPTRGGHRRHHDVASRPRPSWRRRRAPRRRSSHSGSGTSASTTLRP